MGKKKGAIAAKARAKRESKTRGTSPDDGPKSVSAEILPADGCRVHRGLQNLGNTCYFNSMVQCLNVSVPFSDDLMLKHAAPSGNMSSSLSTVFRGIRGVEEPQGKGGFNPKPLFTQLTTRFPWFRGKEQHDAHELLRTLMGAVSDEAEQADPNRGPNGSALDGVARNFRGRLCAATLCWNCSRVTLRLDPFLDLPLTLPSLSGQLIRAMGITPTMATGEEEKLPGGDSDDEAGGNPDDAGTSSRKGAKGGRKAREAAAKASVALNKKTEKKAAVLGVWAAKKEAEENRENSRVYVQSLIFRILQAELAPEEENAAEEEEEAAPARVTYEVELTRQSKKAKPHWGFMWSETKCSEGALVLCSILEDSVVEKWNLKKRALGDEEQMICVGDTLIEVNGETGYGEMTKCLRATDTVALQFARGGPGAGDLGQGRQESDGEEERKAQAAAAKEEARLAFLDAADRCYKELPKVMQDLFGPEEPLKGTPERISLERCLQQFSTVEALEDSFKPTYQCSHCSAKAEQKVKTFASRRMWVWPIGLPPLLTMHLKRFRRYRDHFEKSAVSIALPPVLDLSQSVLSEPELQGMKPFINKNVDIEKLVEEHAAQTNGNSPTLRYELYGLCVHQGSSMKGGHYVAYVNSGPSLEQEKWFCISDANCKGCDRAEVLKAEAYVAFYRREGLAAELAAPRLSRAAAREQSDSGSGDEA